MKNLSFRELSALGSALAILLTAYFYLPDALRLSAALAAGTVDGLTRNDLLYAAAGMIGFLIAVQIVYHIVIAILFRAEAAEPYDERDRLVDLKAGRNGHRVMGLGVVLLGGHLLISSAPDVVVAQYLLAVLFASEFVDYASRFFLYRRAI